MSRRVNASRNGLREMLIAYREHRLPKSTPPPPWSAPRGWPDPLLSDLRDGKPVVVPSATLLSAHMAAGMPSREYRQYCYGGRHYKAAFLLDEHDQLTEVVD